MIGLDTNVLVRLFVEDDVEQTEAARRFVRRECTPASPGYVNSIVLAEFIWVLGRYGYDRSQIALAVRTLLDGPDRRVENREQVEAALAAHDRTGVDLVDCTILEINRSRDCTATATFDRKAGRLDGAVVVG